MNDENLPDIRVYPKKLLIEFTWPHLAALCVLALCWFGGSAFRFFTNAADQHYSGLYADRVDTYERLKKLETAAALAVQNQAIVNLQLKSIDNSLTHMQSQRDDELKLMLQIRNNQLK